MMKGLRDINTQQISCPSPLELRSNREHHIKTLFSEQRGWGEGQPGIKRNLILIVLILLFSSFKANSQTNPQRYPLIPYPYFLKAAAGNFTITSGTSLITDKAFTNEAFQLQQIIQKATGHQLKTNASSANKIILQKDDNITGKEAYQLTINDNSITIKAAQPVGIFRGIETLRQLMPPSVENTIAASVSVPCAGIKDSASYSWRGMHLDVARHFFSIEYLKKFIDVMALYKMDKLHLHLTDDQGWRIEIKKYPKLTEQGAWRTFDKNDSTCIKLSATNPDFAIDTQHTIHKNGQTLYGGFYTQQQLKELVKYAASKHIDIIPEIDMPGHMMAAINAYPYLLCDGTKNEWGSLFSKPICPCNEKTIAFAQDIYTEVFSIFPSEYIHLGADEVDRSTWAKSDACKALMQREGLKSVDELQSWFVKTMEKFFNAHGRKLIGWDEILEGGVSKTAYVMYWRTWVKDAPVKAAQHGNHVIMTPGEPLYFDNPADEHSIDNVYHFNVVPKGLDSNEAKLILGAQANTWTEEVPSEKRAEFLYMPRMTALAERTWSSRLNYDDYLQRLNANYARMDALNINYRLPDISGLVEENVFVDSAVLSVNKPIDNLTIHYTTDGSVPQSTSSTLSSPLIIKTNTNIRLAAFTPNNLRGDIYNLNYKQQPYHSSINTSNNSAGLQCDYYKAFFKNVASIDTATADSSFTANNFIVPSSVNAPSFALVYKGYINVPETGIYTFYLTCDDGGVLYIDNDVVVDNDGLHSARTKSAQTALKQGFHAFTLKFVEGGGGYKLDLKYSFKNSTPASVPESWLLH